MFYHYRRQLPAIILTFIGIILFVLRPDYSYALGEATLSLSTTDCTLDLGEELTVSLRIDTGGENVISVQACLTFNPAKLQATVDSSQSLFPVEVCSVSENGSINIVSGEITPGINAGNGLVAKITFKALEAANPARITFTDESAAMVAQDEAGFDILANMVTGNYIIDDPANNPPYEPVSPNPANGSENQPVDIALSWFSFDPESQDTISYDVYLGTDDNHLLLVANNLIDSTFSPEQLAFSTTYYWKAVARDNNNASSIGSVWSFV